MVMAFFDLEALYTGVLALVSEHFVYATGFVMCV